LNILVVKMSALGDVIQAMAILRPLKMGFPEARITWLVEESLAPILDCNPSVDRTIVWPREAFTSSILKRKEGLHRREKLKEFIQSLRRDVYEIAIDLQGLMKSAIWMGLARARRKVGFSEPREKLSKLFVNEKVRGVGKDLHAVERYLRLVEGLGCPKCEEVEFGLKRAKLFISRAKDLLREGGARGRRPLVVISPATRWETKRWESEKFAELADEMRLKGGFEVVFVGGRGDLDLVRDIKERMRTRAVDLTGETDLPTLACIMGMAEVVVSPDSGPMHLAAAMGTPVVALFGPTAPWRTGPYGKVHKVIRSHVECSPCFRRKCSSRSCMRSISVGEVMEAVERVLVRLDDCPEKSSARGSVS
jgi:lipopolysaccharide heptosyltransferase I